MITFNTGRWYTEFGQRMAAEQTAEGGILFVDVDRNIDGYFRPEVCKKHLLKLDQASVVWGYDHYDKTEYWVGVHGQDERRVWELRKAARELPKFEESRR